MISAIIIFFAGVLNACMDRLKLWGNSIWWNNPTDTWFFKWAGPQSWRNKWKLQNGVLIPSQSSPWYYLKLYKPHSIERFIYSSTFLVFITDAWHFFKTLMIVLFIIAIILWCPVFNNSIYNFILLYASFMIGFTLFYDFILIKK